MALDEPDEHDQTLDAGGITWIVSKRDAPFVLAGEGAVSVNHIDHGRGAFFRVSRSLFGGCC